ncbi:MAG: DivIVA domain-containing protein [Bacillota bacterium]
MKFSPLDIYNKEFKKSAFGYNTGEVDDFLDDVGVAYEKLLKEINSLQEENERLKERLANYENIEDKLSQTLESVQETAREQTRQAKEEADRIIDKANMEADKIRDQARLKAQEEYRALERLKETRQLFEIRFKSLLESHLKLLEDNQYQKDLDQEVAVAENNLDEG